MQDEGWMVKTGMKIIANSSNRMVILLDYHEISQCPYFRMAYEFVPAIGLYLAKVINQLKIPPENVDLLGHSLGSCYDSLFWPKLMNQVLFDKKVLVTKYFQAVKWLAIPDVH